MSKVIALAVADIHLSENPPVARSAESDWLAAQQRPLDQLRALAEKHDCPILCAGDVFDKYNPSPTLINWAIEHLPTMYAIPGQHDLPYHNHEEISRSAYWTLAKEGTLLHLGGLAGDFGGALFAKMNLNVRAFPFGVKIEPCQCDDGLNIAIAHQMVWKNNKPYPDAPGDVTGMKKQLQGYDVAIFGDNHSGFDAKIGDTIVWNCGCLIPRKITEKDYEPVIGLIWDDGMVKGFRLDTSEDKWIDETPETCVSSHDMDEVLSVFGNLAADSLDFREVVERYLRDNDVRKPVKQVILEAMG